MLHQLPTQAFPNPYRSNEQPYKQGDRSDRRLLDQAIVRYQQAERLAERAAQYRQQAEWLLAEARAEEQQTNYLVHLVGSKERARIREAERAHRRETRQQEAAAVVVGQGHQPRNQQRQRSQPKRVRFRLLTGR